MSTAAIVAHPKGWYRRAHEPFGKPHFAPTLDQLVLVALSSTPVEPDGFTAALFRPNFVVDSHGQLLQVQENDFRELTELSVQANALPDTGASGNTWRVASETTESTIDKLYINVSGTVKETSVQGWSLNKTKLAVAVAGHEELPPVLQKLVQYIREARPEDVNKELIAQVKALVNQ
ncbi:hypothetical protein BD413DRAFT_10898 [Trametes elegans]|nr:hypothetical protein BD413DRAFT_10898 [Trametes elegans]